MTVKIYRGLIKYCSQKRLELWWDNKKHNNDPTGHIEVEFDIEKFDKDLQDKIIYHHNKNTDFDTFVIIAVDIKADENKKVLLDFVRDKDFEDLIQIKRRLGFRGTKAFELE